MDLASPAVPGTSVYANGLTFFDCTIIFYQRRVLLLVPNRMFQLMQLVLKFVSSNIYPTRCNVTQFIWQLLYMFWVVPPPIIRSANCTYSIWYLSHLSHRYCYLPLSWKNWNWFECAVGGVCYPQHTQISSNSSTIAADSSNGVTNTIYCRYSCLRSWR